MNGPEALGGLACGMDEIEAQLGLADARRLWAMTLVSAGLALGLAGEAHIASSREPGVVARRLAGKPYMLTTYLLRRDAEPSEMLARFIERVAFIDSADGIDAADDA